MEHIGNKIEEEKPQTFFALIPAITRSPIICTRMQPPTDANSTFHIL